jgi:hypothetical protein
MVRNQPDVLAAQRRELFCFEDVESRLHSRGASAVLRMFYGGVRGKTKREGQANENDELFYETAASFRQAFPPVVRHQ